MEGREDIPEVSFDQMHRITLCKLLILSWQQPLSGSYFFTHMSLANTFPLTVIGKQTYDSPIRYILFPLASDI